MPAGGFQLGRHGRDVHVVPDLELGADGQAVALKGHAHRSLEDAEVGVEVVPLIANNHELAGLVGGDQERSSELCRSAGKFGVRTARNALVLQPGGAAVADVCPLAKTAVDKLSPLGVVQKRATGTQSGFDLFSVRGDGGGSVRDFYIFLQFSFSDSHLPTGGASRGPRVKPCQGISSSSF